MLDDLKSFCAALATRGPVRLRVEVNAEAWRTLRAEFHRPYKHEPNAGFTLYLEGGAGTVEFVPETPCAHDLSWGEGCPCTAPEAFAVHPPPTEGNS